MASLDLVVVGAGMAGIAAALRARELGLAVRLLEARSETRHPNNTRWSGGVFHVAFRSMYSDPGELAPAVVAYTNGTARPELAEALAGNAERGIRWLAAQGVGLDRIEPTEGWRDAILAPLGYHDRPGLHWDDFGADRMMNRLEEVLGGHGASIERGRRAVALLIDNGACRGVRLEGGETVEARATLLADGGFQGSPELLARYVTPYPERFRQRGPGTSPGDGIRMVVEAGAELTGIECFYGHLLSADAKHNDKLMPFPFIDFVGGSGVLVDRNGERFADEGGGGVYMANQAARHPDADPFFAVFDSAIWEGPGRHFFFPPNPNLTKYGGTLHRADDLDGLAAMAGLPADRLKATVAAHNRALAGDGFNQLTPPRTNPVGGGKAIAARPIATPPFYAAPGCVAITHTMGGVLIDAKARVMTANGPIPGLLAAGNAAGGIEGGPRANYVGGLGIALVFGIIAAETVAGQ